MEKITEVDKTDESLAQLTARQELGSTAVSEFIGMGAYSNSEIRSALDAGHIVIHPYNPENVQGSSVDVTLGSFFYRIEPKSDHELYNPFDPEETARFFRGPLEPISAGEWAEKNKHYPLINIPEDHPIIVLQPKERILAHTHEFIGIKGPGTSSMQARSSWGRNGVSVCVDAGWGDPGYINRWTMEIENRNQNHSIVLPIGERIAQIVFFHTGEVEGEYAKLSGKYQTAGQNNIEQTVADWKPELMLPRAYKDKRVKPRVIS